MQKSIKGMTFNEISENWENIPPEEQESFIKRSQELRSSVLTAAKAYNVKPNYENTTEHIANRFYAENLIMAGVLEAFYAKSEISLKDLNQSIENYIHSELKKDLTLKFQKEAIAKTIKLGYITVVETEDGNMPNFKITDLGIKTMQNQTFQTLAATSFFNYQTQQLNNNSVKISNWMLIIAIISVVASIVSICVK